MRTRRGKCYPEVDAFMECIYSDREEKRKRDQIMNGRKRMKATPAEEENYFLGYDLFEALPDDIIICILCKLISTADCPADFMSMLLTCKRLNHLSLQSVVLSKACDKTVAVKAENWSESAHRFLKLCSDAGSAEACFTLGMIRFYCLNNRGSGASLMAKAAMCSHESALYSLAVIQFNGSGGTKNEKDLQAGVALCTRAAFLGHVDALRELGHCLQDGYGVKQNIMEGRRFLVQANARELAIVLATAPSAVVPRSWLAWSPHRHSAGPLLSDFGCNVPTPEAHPANQFLSDWFSTQGRNPGPGLRLCSHSGCGRPETRIHEFRRCSVCGAVNYCSRACQALDWKYRHKTECTPAEGWVDQEDEWVDEEDEDNEANENGGEEVNGNGNGYGGES